MRLSPRARAVVLGVCVGLALLVSACVKPHPIALRNATDVRLAVYRGDEAEPVVYLDPGESVEDFWQAPSTVRSLRIAARDEAGRLVYCQRYAGDDLDLIRLIEIHAKELEGTAWLGWPERPAKIRSCR